jgi:hypothetical protein
MAVDTEDLTLLTFQLRNSVLCTDLYLFTCRRLIAPYSREYVEGYCQFKFIRPGQYFEF